MRSGCTKRWAHMLRNLHVASDVARKSARCLRFVVGSKKSLTSVPHCNTVKTGECTPLQHSQNRCAPGTKPTRTHWSRAVQANKPQRSGDQSKDVTGCWVTVVAAT